MVSFLLTPIFILLISAPVSAQNQLPENPQAIRSMLLNLELPDEPQTREEYWRKQFDRYMQGIRAEIGVTHSLANGAERSSIDRGQLYTQLKDCLTKVKTGFQGSFIPALQTIVSECDKTYDQLSRTYRDQINEMGNETPTRFLQRLERENKLAEQRMATFDHPDEATIINEFTVADQINYQLDPSSNVLTPANVKLATEVVSVMLELYQSNDVTDITQAEETNQAMLEVVQLGQMVSIINQDLQACSYDLLADDIESHDLTQARSILIDGYVVHDNEAQPALTAFFGIDPEKLKKIKAYRIDEGDRQVWLFRDGRGGLEEVWVMAEYDPETQALSYRHFTIRDARQEGLVARETISILPVFRGGDATNRSDSHVLFESELGLRLEADRQSLPVVGNTALPTGRVILGSARLRSFGNRVGSDTSLNIDIDQVSLRTSLHNNRNTWSVGATSYYKTFDNKWHAGVDTRVYNLMAGASSNLDKEFQYHVGLVVKRNYANVNVNQNGATYTIGRQFAGNRGGAAVNTDFKKTANFRLYLFIN